MWLIVLLLVLILVFGPMLWVRFVMHSYATDIPGMPGTGGELAAHLIERFKLDGVRVEISPIGDHYNPVERTVGLSEQNYSSKSGRVILQGCSEPKMSMTKH